MNNKKENFFGKKVKGSCKRMKDVLCLVCRKRLRHYQWKTRLGNKSFNICSDLLCSGKCRDIFEKSI